MQLVLRDYQESGIADIGEAFRRSQNVLYVLPTGGGKSAIFTSIAKRAQVKNKTVLVLVHRNELLKQARDHFRSMGINSGQIKGGKDMALAWPIQVGSIQTVSRRLDKLPNFDLIVCDEGHHAVSATYRKIFARYPRTRVLGVTATPWRMGTQGLNQTYQDMILGPDMRTLIDRGFLAQPVVYAPPLAFGVQAELDAVKTVAGELDAHAQEVILDKPTIIGSAVEHYRKLCDGKPAIAFCASVRHATHVAEQFNAAGIRSAMIDGEAGDLDRDRMIKGLANGQIQVLTSCDLIGEGVDIPIVAASIMLRRTKSLVVYLQQAGRAMRLYPGKDEALVIDHVGNCRIHGLPDMSREWSLEGRKPRSRKKDDEPDVQSLKTCPQCWCTHETADKCPSCGWVYLLQSREGPKEVDGQLVKISAADLKIKKQQELRKAKTLEELQDIARERGYAPGWAVKQLEFRRQAALRHRQNFYERVGR